jgi:hypothetical protein
MSDEHSVTLLLLLRLKAFAPTDRLADWSELPVDVAAATLAACEATGLVQQRTTPPALGWSLTAAGRRDGAAMLRAELASSGTTESVEAHYREFLPLNVELLSICTDWQTVVIDGVPVPNPHDDPARDAQTLTRLDRLHSVALPLLESLAGAVPRFRGYAGRLDHAVRRVRQGATDWLAKPTIDSYHGIWFELHEHLLASLGRDRTSEAAPAHAPTPSGDPR